MLILISFSALETEKASQDKNEVKEILDMLRNATKTSRDNPAENMQ